MYAVRAARAPSQCPPCMYGTLLYIFIHRDGQKSFPRLRELNPREITQPIASLLHDFPPKIVCRVRFSFRDDVQFESVILLGICSALIPPFHTLASSLLSSETDDVRASTAQTIFFCSTAASVCSLGFGFGHCSSVPRRTTRTDGSSMTNYSMIYNPIIIRFG